MPRKQPRRKRGATRIFEILTPRWSAKPPQIAKSNEISMIWPISSAAVLAAHKPDLRVLKTRRKVAKRSLELQVCRGRAALPARQHQIFHFRPLFPGSWSGGLSQPMGEVAQKGAKGGSETLFAQRRVLGRTRAADHDFDGNFGISRVGREPEPETCQIVADLLEIYWKSKGRANRPDHPRPNEGCWRAQTAPNAFFWPRFA